MKRLIQRTVVAALAALFAHAGWTLGLGNISLRSHLNEPLRAELLLLKADGLDAADIQLGLASQQEFERLGVDRAYFLTGIVFDVEVVDATLVAQMTTKMPLREPYLNFVVEARWPEGRLLREYTLLIDLPPTMTEATVGISAQRSSREAALPEKRASATESSTADVIRPGGSYLVRNADTLWRIASTAKPERITIEQAMLSIVLLNPEAFDRENVNGLKSGYLLNLPTAGDIFISARDARAEVARQNVAWSDPSSGLRPGLTLVADPTSAIDQALPAPPLTATPDTLPPDEAPTQPDLSVGSAQSSTDMPTSPEFDALLIKVEALERNLQRMEQQLKQRDIELEVLRSQLLAATTKPELPIIVTQPEKDSFRWLVLGAVGLLIAGALAGWLGQRARSRTQSGGDDGVKHSEQLETRAEMTQEGLLSDPQIRAAKALEEAEVYLAYGRPDQAEEVLSAAFRDGATSQSLVLRLLECYLEQSHFREAQSLLAQIEQGGDAELIERGSQILTSAGVTRAPEGTGLSLVPVTDNSEEVQSFAEAGVADQESSGTEESIYGLETDPVDSKLDLARAYLDMGDEEGARLVLTEVIREGNLTQQAEARELLLRLEVS
jgi:pilus assembly protein FimV